MTNTKCIVLSCLMILGGWACSGVSAQSKAAEPVVDQWRLALQCWTFNRYTLFETLDRAAALGIEYIEAYPGQAVSPERPDLKFGPGMTAEERSYVKDKLRSNGLKLVNFGVVGMPEDEAGQRQLFEFAEDMGIETIAAEPAEAVMDSVDQLCQEFRINLAIHNHPKPSGFWDAQRVVDFSKDRSKYIGSCADTGHWRRSGLDAADCCRKLDGRIVSFHYKDVVKVGDEWSHAAKDVPWGTGMSNSNDLLAQLYRQGFQGVFSIEYERNDIKDLMPDLRQCVEYFNEQKQKLDQTGWQNLFAADLSNCVYPEGSWTYENGMLTRQGGGYVWTKDRYGDFILDLDYKVSENANSGVFIRCGSLEDWINTCIEVQIHDTTDGTKHGQCGAIYDCLSPSQNVLRPANEWNHLTIIALGNRIKVFMNTVQVIDMDLDLWAEAGKNPQGTPNKFSTAYKDMPREGYIGFQDHGDAVWYRNVRIKPFN